MATPQKLKVSVAQTACQAYDLEATLAKLEELTHFARSRDGSQLIVFPEAFIGGYPKLATFGAVVGERTPEGRDEFLRYHSAAIEVSATAPAIARIAAISKSTGVFLVVGVIEREGGSLYCTQVFIDPEVGYIAKHRKLAPTASERLIWGQGDGSTLHVLEQSFGDVKAKVSGAVCWENYMPLLRHYYYSKGTQIHCVSTVDARPVWQNTMIHIALEGRCFVLSACQWAEEKDYPQDHAVRDAANRDPGNVMIAGGSVIVDPLGQVLAGPLLKGEGVLSAEIDLNECVRGKFDLDVVGHYARPDVFGFTANV
ncbi:carbon-nitrogen hydrolase [Cylindrobasidium torrendii FP15055 ss-10]|uniref:Carbon-nitrogen hydrolase n=1 Tax=Cylindrobasidium torrendii FP15055 ss-10 TaxID=1314674 RepID=A0A0D7B4K4_9AGAR|nr:carbon-nitrogen hydrolase [Cylindrobasidium torrendii FP15055 ss-10]